MAHGETTLPTQMSEEALCAMLFDAGAISLRDVDGGEDPFKYSSGNFGPGYVDVKGTVGEQAVFKPLVQQLGLKVIEEGVAFDFVAGNATGGMVPAYEFREQYQDLTALLGEPKEVPYVYIRNSRKEGGLGEHVTGLKYIPPTQPDGSTTRGMVMEELVNYAATTTNSTVLLRNIGFEATHAATLLTYGHAESEAKLADAGINLVALLRLETLLDFAAADKRSSADAVASYREFLAGPAAWQEKRGIVPEDMSGPHG